MANVSVKGLLSWIHRLSWERCNSWHANMLWFQQFASRQRPELTGHCLKRLVFFPPQLSGTKQLVNQIAGRAPWVTDIPLRWLPTPTPPVVAWHSLCDVTPCDVMIRRCSVSRNPWHDWQRLNKHRSPRTRSFRWKPAGKIAQRNEKATGTNSSYWGRERQRTERCVWAPTGLESGVKLCLFQTYQRHQEQGGFNEAAWKRPEKSNKATGSNSS